MAATMASLPASMPAPKFPARKWGRTMSSRICRDRASVRRDLEAVAHLDAHPALLAGHDEEDAVVHALPAELPGLEDAHRVVLDRVALETVHREDRHLGARALLEVGQFRLEAVPDRRRDDARDVVHPGAEERHLLRGQGDGGGEQQREARRAERRVKRARFPARAGA